jgi:hypothetical protein
MNDEFRESIAVALGKLIENGNVKVRDEGALFDLWREGLSDLSDDQINYGVSKVIRECKSGFLTISEFREFASTLPGTGGFESEAEEAWSLVMRYLSRYSSPVFKNSVISETIRGLGGWNYFANMTEKEKPFRRQDFISLYLVYRKRGGEYDPRLSGMPIDEPDYRFIGYTPEEARELLIEYRKADEIEYKNTGKLIGMYAEKVREKQQTN